MATLQSALAPFPVRDRCRVVLAIAERLRAAIAAQGDDAGAADAAITAMKRWIGGEPVTGRTFSDLVYDEEGEGVALHTMEGAFTAATPDWSALTVAVMYVAWHAYQASGERMPEDVAEVDEDTLSMLEDLWTKSSAYDAAVIPSALERIGGQEHG